MSLTKERKAAKDISDAIALAHFLVANVIVVLGQVTGLFRFMEVKNPGVEFIKQYVCTPAIPMLTWLLMLIESISDGLVRLMHSMSGGFSDPRVKEATKSGFLFVDRFFTDPSFWGLFLSTEAIIIFASIFYWVVCYLSVRMILSVTS